MKVPVELAPGVLGALRLLRDRGEPPPRCHKGPIRNAVAEAVRGLVEDDLESRVRPWDLPALQRRAAALGDVTSARAVHVDEDVLVAELKPGGQRIVLRGVDDGWRLVRFANGDDYTLRPESSRTVGLTGWGPAAVLRALGIEKPEGLEMEHDTEDLGQGEYRSVSRYQWSDGDRSVLAEHVKTEIYDGATPYSTWVRGVVVAGDRGTLLFGPGDTATVIDG